MTLLAGFLDVLLRGLGLVAFSIAVGGVAFLLLLGAGRTGPSALDARARARSLRLIAGTALTLAVTTTMALGLKPWALASPDGRWPVLAFLGTEYAVVGVLRVAAAALLAGLAGITQRSSVSNPGGDMNPPPGRRCFKELFTCMFESRRAFEVLLIRNCMRHLTKTWS